MFKFFAFCLLAVVALVSAAPKPDFVAYSTPIVAAEPYTAAYTAAYTSPYTAAYSAYSAYPYAPYAAAYSTYPYAASYFLRK